MYEHTSEYGSQRAAIRSIASKIGCSAQSLSTWIKRRETDLGQRPDITTEEQARVKGPERGVKELRRANEILHCDVGIFCPGGALPPRDVMVALIDAHR